MADQTPFLKLLLLSKLRKRVKRRQRTVYVRDLFMTRNEVGESTLLRDLRGDPYYHFRYFRMNKENFDWLLEKVTPLLKHKTTHLLPITALERLGITIRYLASGNSQFTMATSYRMSTSAVCMIIRETVAALIKVLQKEFLPAPSEEMWTSNEKRFSEVWNFPNACGSLDGKHIRLKSPPSSGSLYYNYKGYFSIVLLAIANADFQFSAVDIGAYGSESDGGVLWRSQMGKALQDNSLGLPPAKVLQRNGPSVAVPHVLLGDDAFPLRQNLMKPFKGNFLPKETRVFNYRLSRARMTVENSFGILVARWRIFNGLIETNVELSKKIVLVTVLLHNYLTSKSDFNDITPDRVQNGRFIEGNWRTMNGNSALLGVCQQGSNNRTATAAEVRDNFKQYFMTDEGRVPWQDSHVDKGL